MNRKVYAVYKGEDWKFDGTLAEIAEHFGWTRNTVRWYTYKAAHKRSRRKLKNRSPGMIELIDIKL